MRIHLKKPGFEFIFALSLIVIMGLPPFVFAQDTKNTEIRIANGDTVINGKNIKELSPADRKQALKDIDNLGELGGNNGNGKHRIVIRKRAWDGAMADQFRLPNDSAGRFFKFKMNRMGNGDSTFNFNYKMDGDRNMRFDDRDFAFNEPRHRMNMEFRRRNTQSFNYTNTGTDGISTNVSFRVSDPSPEKLKELGGSETSELELKDLNLVPEFSSGKTLLLFSLPSHAAAEVKLTDHDGKLLWSDKAINGTFNKSFALGLNGIYFLQVKQAGKVAVKRIIKEE